MLNGFAHGRIGRDTELRYTADGTAVAEIALACDYGRKGQDGHRPTQWLRAAVWGKQAEALAPYLTKGKGVVIAVEDVHVREYDGKNGKGFALEARVIGVEFTGAGPREDDGSTQRQPAPAARPAPGRSPVADMDDDVPF